MFSSFVNKFIHSFEQQKYFQSEINNVYNFVQKILKYIKTMNVY